MTLKYLVRSEAEGKRMSQKVIHNHENIKQDKTDEPEGKEKINFLINVLLVLHLTSCTLTRLQEQGLARGQAWLAHRPSREAGQAHGHPSCYRAPKQYHGQKSKLKSCKKKASFEHIWNRPVLNAAKVIDSFCKCLCHCRNTEPPGAQLSFSNGGGNYFSSALLIPHTVETAQLFFFS